MTVYPRDLELFFASAATTSHLNTRSLVVHAPNRFNNEQSALILTERHLTCIVDRYPNLTALNLHMCNMTGGLSELNRLSKLRQLRFSNSDVPEWELVNILLPHLHVFSLSNGRRVVPESLMFFLSRHPLITGLELPFTDMDCTSRMIADVAPHLYCLNLNCSNFSSDNIARIALCAHSLSVLRLQYLTLDGTALQCFTNLPLQELDLSGVRFTSRYPLTRLSLIQTLVSLSLADIQGLTDADFTAFYFYNLRVLNLTGIQISSAAFVYFVARCPRLQDVDITRCSNLKNKSLLSLSKTGLLKRLCIAYCRKITSAALYSLAESPHLTALSLSACRRIWNKTLIHIAERCTEIQSLNLSRLTKLDDSTLTKLVEELSCLQNLTIDGCPKLTDTAIAALFTRMPQLTELSMCWGNFTDKSLQCIAALAFGLQFLALRGNQFTEDGIKLVRHRCPSLHTIEV